MNETFEQVLGYMTAHESGDAEEAFFDRVAWRELIVRLRAAHERAMAAKDAEIERFKAALKPVMECYTVECTKSEALRGARVPDYFAAFYAAREAQRIAKEGGVA